MQSSSLLSTNTLNSELCYILFQREEARSVFHEKLEEIEQIEKDEAHKAEIERERNELEALHHAAYVDGLQGDVLFKALFLEDGEAERVKLLPDLPEMLKE